MMVESAFSNVKTRKPRKSRKQRRNYMVEILPDVRAKGRYPKGQGFNKRTRIKGRKPIMGDRMVGNEDALWLMAGRG